MSACVGYTRVSTAEQGRSGLGLEAQRLTILTLRPDAQVRVEVASGGAADDRPVLTELLRELRRGDTLVVARVDRLTRSLADFARISEDLTKRGVRLVVADVGLDTSTPAGELMANMLASFARFERRMIAERIREAWVPKRQAHPVWGPREDEIRRLRERGLSQRAIARELGTHKEVVARALRRLGS